MTRVVLKEKGGAGILFHMEDPRTRRELVIAINTGELVVGAEFNALHSMYDLSGQFAVSQAPEDEVQVTLTPPPFRLTRRQWEVLMMMADGKTTGQIARSLRITKRTVYLHFRDLKRRFGADNLQELMAKAGDHGMTRP